MTELLRCHVINLPRRSDRRRDFLARNAGLADFVFVEASDGSSLDRGDLVADGLLAADARHITDGALGCALSHRRVWLDCLESAQPMVVCEDDAVLAHDFSRLAAEAMASAPDCDILWFGYNFDQPLALHLADGLLGMMQVADRATTDAVWLESYARRPGVAPQRTAVVPPAMVWGLLAYAVTPAGALRLLSECFPLRNHALALPPDRLSRGIDGSVLALVQDGRLSGGCCVPPIVVGPNSDSDTELRDKRS